MKQLDVIVPNPTGLHARPAKVFAKIAKQFEAKIQIQHGEKRVNAKSVISVLTLGVEKDGQVSLTAEGPDADTALMTLKEAIETGLGDDLSATNHKPKSQEAKAENNSAAHGPDVVAEDTVTEKKQIQAVPAAAGIAIGPLYQLKNSTVAIEDMTSDTPVVADPATEKERLESAIEEGRSELKATSAQLEERLGKDEAAIFEAHLEILNDPELAQAAHDYIEQGQSANRAWQTAFNNVAETLASLSDETLAARATDIRDVGNRVLRIMSGAPSTDPNLPDHPVILIGPDLTPSDTVALDPDLVLGFCTAHGGATGHTAILARALGLPAIVGAGEGVLQLDNGTQAILNGETGLLQLEPDEATLNEAQKRQQVLQTRSAAEMAAAQSPAITTDGHHVEVVANIGNLAEAKQAIKFGAEGVGLLRTEFLFLERQDPPSEDEQFEIYRDIALALEGRPIIIRTLDVGGDKPLAYLPVAPEDNPFLGQRGIRLCLAQPEILRTQVRAILRAAEYGHLRIMFPMITTIDDWRRAKALVDEIQSEMNAKPIELGIMVEVPAAALSAQIFAPEVDFFSIGTNDLTQYTLAMDRGNPALFDQADALHPAVLSLIERTVDAAHTAGKWVGVCGELAADPQAVPILIGLGVDELSGNVPSLPAVKAQIRTLSLPTTQTMASQALGCATAKDVRHNVH